MDNLNPRSYQRGNYDRDIQPHHQLTLNIESSTVLDKYPAKAHARRVAAELSKNSKTTATLLVLQSTPSTTYPDSDMPPPFRQDRYFYYLTGCPEPDCYCTYDIPTDTLTLWLPEINWDRLIWTGRGSTIKEAMNKYDIDQAKYYSASTAASPSSNPSDLPFPTNPSTTLLNTPSLSPTTATTPLKTAINTTRTYKDAHEIHLIAHANHITALAHRSVLKNLHTLHSEPALEALYTSTCIANHARTQAYAPIVGSSANASVLHYTANGSDFGTSELVVLDAGVEWQNYASDVTRTVPLNRHKPGTWASAESARLHAAVSRMQDACLAGLKPGVRFWELFTLAHEIAIEELIAMGILKGEKEALLQAGWSRVFFMHGLGHHIGLETHDVNTAVLGSAPRRGARAFWEADGGGAFAAPCCPESGVLEVGMVVTVEPGLYFNREDFERKFAAEGGVGGSVESAVDLQVLEKYFGVGGVRIEDDVVITRNGYRNLTLEAGAVKGEAMLELIREGAA
ncbi:hypothetical protein MBLNU230_g1916t1 [Neophaeotheca triangularis]